MATNFRNLLRQITNNHAADLQNADEQIVASTNESRAYLRDVVWPMLSEAAQTWERFGSEYSAHLEGTKPHDIPTPNQKIAAQAKFQMRDKEGCPQTILTFTVHLFPRVTGAVVSISTDPSSTSYGFLDLPRGGRSPSVGITQLRTTNFSRADLEGHLLDEIERVLKNRVPR